jgi:hypothetical protein
MEESKSAKTVVNETEVETEPMNPKVDLLVWVEVVAQLEVTANQS